MTSVLEHSASARATVVADNTVMSNVSFAARLRVMFTGKEFAEAVPCFLALLLSRFWQKGGGALGGRLGGVFFSLYL